MLYSAIRIPNTIAAYGNPESQSSPELQLIAVVFGKASVSAPPRIGPTASPKDCMELKTADVMSERICFGVSASPSA